MDPNKTVSVEYRGRVAILTICNEKKLGALSHDEYLALAVALNEIGTRDEVVTTVLTGTGRFYSAGADVTAAREAPSLHTPNHCQWLQNYAALQLTITHAFSHHPKILVVALNGPAIGFSAALIAWADFIYCAPHAYLFTPFSSLGLVAEGGASRALARRLGAARANEALLMGKKIDAEVLKACGFVNEIFDVGGTGSGGGDREQEARRRSLCFRDRVLKEVEEQLGEHLNGESVLETKKLLRRSDGPLDDAQSVQEIFTGLDRFRRGIPQEEFRKLASGAKRHKL
ncbi:hypothetical protein E4U56_000586 [Claviceps arundinis]|uniref:3,2-trans-enoyl-CoA isomerase n=1 Tax=Claviceps arundinis TaxID=1623583 RepID=A0A9P7MTT6_9HYPO|nr:hypothetical protein E4U56_000586 [Claviceps arundinis]